MGHYIRVTFLVNGVTKMKRLNSRDLTAIALCAALWGVLNSIFAPVFFRITGLPVLCDFIGFSVLTIGAWWIRKTGAITIIGLIATVINFIFNPEAFNFSVLLRQAFFSTPQWDS